MSVRPIATDLRIAGVDAGPAPELAWLPLDQLVIDDDYQRPLGRENWRKIEKIAAAFSWSHFSPIVVARRGDHLFCVIDGQHRCHAALAAGLSQVPCMIVALDQRGQAGAFTAINGAITFMRAEQVYRAALIAGEPWALDCQRVVAAAGCLLVTSNDSYVNRRAGRIYAVSLVRGHVAAGRGQMVQLALAAMWRAKKSDGIDVWQSKILLPWMRILQDTPDALACDLGAFIAANDPLAIDARVDQMRGDPKWRKVTKQALFQSVWMALLRDWMARGGR